MPKYAVYELWDPRTETPFYVGWTGRLNSRIHEHLTLQDKGNKWKLGKIRKILSIGEVVKVVIPFQSDSMEESLQVEVTLIAKYGRLDKRTGTLTNFTDGGGGLNGQIGWLKGKTWAEAYGQELAEIRRIDASIRMAKYNKTIIARQNSSCRQKGKSLESRYGVEVANKMKKIAREQLTGNKIWVGRNHKETSKELMRQARLNEHRVISVETSRKLSEAAKKRKLTKEYRALMSKIRSEFRYSSESKLRMSLSQKLRSYGIRHCMDVQPYKEKLAQCENSIEALSNVAAEFKTELHEWR